MGNNNSMMLGQNNMMFGNNQIRPGGMGMMMPPNSANPGNAGHSKLIIKQSKDYPNNLQEKMFIR
jgi:hypothetical protein